MEMPEFSICEGCGAVQKYCACESALADDRIEMPGEKADGFERTKMNQILLELERLGNAADSGSKNFNVNISLLKVQALMAQDDYEPSILDFKDLGKEMVFIAIQGIVAITSLVMADKLKQFVTGKP